MIEKKTLEQLQTMSENGTLQGKFDVDIEVYHELDSPGVSKSDLDLIKKMPYLYYVQKITREYKPEPTEVMVLGGAIHAALIEPMIFATKYVSDGQYLTLGSRNTKAYKSAVEMFEIQNPEKILLKKDDYDIIIEILKSVQQTDLAKILLSEGEAEMSYYWKREFEYSIKGEKFKRDIVSKCRPDYVRISKTGKSYITEIKSTDNAVQFTSKKIKDFRYYVQAAICLEGIQQITGCDPNQLYFVFLVVEKSFPFGIRLIELPMQAIIHGIKERNEDMEKLLICTHNKRFTKYEDVNDGELKIEIIDLPNYVYYEYELKGNK